MLGAGNWDQRLVYPEKAFLYSLYRGDNRTMAKKTTGRRPEGNLVKEIDAAIALLTRVRALAASTAVSDGTSRQAAKPTPVGKQAKRALSSEAREKIAAAQKKRWAKVRRQKKKAEREALAQQSSATPASGSSDTK
jgi:hypothetical protein